MKTIKSIYMIIIMMFLYLPIVTLMVFSFNESKSMFKWTGLSLKWYKEMFTDDQMLSAIWNTFSIATSASVIATIIGTLACVGIVGMSRRGQTIVMGFNNIPLLNADIVTGISLMLSFIAFGFYLNWGTVLMAHITFCIPYVILSVMPKLKQMGTSNYEAALDLGASPFYAFRKVVIPDIKSGIISGFLLAFTMSVDDFVVTHFTRGAGINTISTLIYSQVKVGIRPTLFALSTVIFVVVLIILTVTNFAAGREDEEEEFFYEVAQG
jgi:spermidine/putrescine transport system permease protein